jgi:hypothetical protein
MIDKAELKDLLTQSETETLDFKSKPHRLDNEHFKSEFIKDIIAMANTPREDTAYIVIGVKEHSNGKNELKGVSQHHDDADLQPILNKAEVEPRPRFCYQPVNLEGKTYGVIEVPISENGPFYAQKDYGVLKACHLYFRRGTTNDRATGEETNRIHKWFLESSEEPTKDSEASEYRVVNWDQFELACHHFDKNRLYLFVLGPKKYENEEAWPFLAHLPISLVLDFDPQTAQNGVYSVVSPAMRRNRDRFVNLWTLGNESDLVPERACYWYAAKGLRDRESTLCNGDWRRWNRKYGTALTGLMDRFVRASGGRPLTVVILWYAPEYVREVCSMVDRTFGDLANYVFAVPEAERYAGLASQFEGETIGLRIEDVLYGIAQNVDFSVPMSPLSAIPRSDGGFHILREDDLSWLSVDLQILHTNIELEPTPDREVRYDYLRGATINWADLAGHYDADREITSQLKELVKRDLSSRKAHRINLYHWPGAGGTTVARRVAWDLRRVYPVVLLRRITPGETVERFREVFQSTGQPILAVVEGSDATPAQIDQLYKEAATENLPVVFLSVLRTFDRKSGSRRSVFLGQNLSRVETHNFIEQYSRAVPERGSQLESFRDRGRRERTPFLFALTTFEKDFVGVTDYLKDRLDAANPVQTELLTFLSLAYYYGHKPVLGQFFAAHLGIPEDRSVRIESILDEPQLELVLEEENGKWRPVHQIIAEETLKSVLSGSYEERRNWKRQLTNWAINFIKICRKGTLVPSDELIDLLRRVFILRDESELLGTENAGSSRFSKLIDDIQTKEGRLSVLQTLVEYFPEEAHFWGHLGRFYSRIMKDWGAALEAVEKAVGLSPHDPILHHMKGMCYRQKIYDIMWKSGNLSSREPVEAKIRELSENSLEAFEESRELDPESWYGYVSPIQLLINILDWGYQESGCDSRAEFLGLISSGWYRDQLDEAESLLAELRTIRRGEKPSGYTLDCQARLNRIYDDYSRALQDWTNLLGRRDVYAPPIRRQIVRTYLARRERDWSSLERREIERIVDLMEQNLREEPDSEHNLRLWFRAYRLSARRNIDLALDRLAHWRALGDSQDSYYYLYILHVIKAIEGASIEKVRAEDLIKQSSQKARDRRNRTRSFEWLGKGEGLERLVHYTELGEWDKTKDFYGETSRLARVEGRITQINAPEAGTIELKSCGLHAFFVPAKSGARKGRDENRLVTFYLGFSYDGLRAWSVHLKSR